MAWRNGIVTGVVVGLLGVVFSSTSGGAGRAQGNGAIKLNCAQQPCDQVARGRAAFNDGNLKALGGNGRACADCHMPSEHFQLSPAAARERFEALLAKREFNKNADDALFRPVDADDFRMNGENASDFSNLIDNGLVRVTLPLPPNVRLLDPVTGQPTNETATDLFRAVMPVMNVAITGPDGVVPIWPPAPRVPIPGVDPNGPNRQGGYQHDARFATLQEQARGALIAHAQVSVEPPSDMLDDLAAFQQTLFSSPGVERLAEAIASGSTPFPDPDPELTEIEQQGKSVFNRACAQCHGGTLHPSGSTPEAAIVRPIVRYHNIQTACPRPATDGYMPCPQLACAQRAHISHHARERHLPNAHDLGPGTSAPNRATCGPRSDGHHPAARDQQDRALLPQQLRGDARGGGRPLRSLLRARGSAESAAQLATDSFVERPGCGSRV